MDISRKQINAATKKEYGKKHSEILSGKGFMSPEWATWKAWKSLGRKTKYGLNPVTIEYCVKGKEWTVDLYNQEQTEPLPVAKVIVENKELVKSIEDKLLSQIVENQNLQKEINRLKESLHKTELLLKVSEEYSKGLEKALNYYSEQIAA